MPEFEKIEVAASLFVVIVGWFAQKWLDRRNNRLSRREEIRMKFLIESYSALNFFIHKGLEQRADGLKFQEVLNTIFLLGGRDLVNSVMAFQAYDHGEERPGGRVEIGTVLQQLRKQVREELKLDFRNDDPNSMRFSSMYPDGPVGSPAGR